MILEVYDIECLSNFFSYTSYCPKEDKYYQFVISDWRNDIDEFYTHLFRDKLLQVGYNNLAYDYTIIHHIINHYSVYRVQPGQFVAQSIYKKSQETIDQQFSEIADRNKFIPQLDLFKIWHYNNKARMTSLKDLEIAMRLDNVEEMPIHHTQWCTENDEQCILDYNLNDVKATYKFLLTTLGKTDYSLYKGKDKIHLRNNLAKKFNFSCTNLPDVRIGEQLMLTLYSRSIGKSIHEIKQLRTPRDSIYLGDCIPKWENIQSPEFYKFKQMLLNTTISGGKGEFTQTILFHGLNFDFATGGAHACIKPGIYKSDENNVIIDLDVSSLYPSIAKSLNLYPEHLGPQFTELYSQFIDARVAEKHKSKDQRDNVLIEGYKLLLNGTYGKSGEDTSFMFDRLYTYKTTIAGQIFIAMWCERMVAAVSKLRFLQANTDGVSILIPRSEINTIRKVCDKLTEETSLVIEEVFYDSMIVRDVNNYIGVYSDSTPEHEHLKLKGCFEIDKEYHKDPSMRIVPIALKEFFVNNIPIADTIRNHKDIYDFCLRLKTNSKSQAIYKCIKDGKIVDEKLPRTTRYYISNNGGNLYKDLGEGRITGVNVGYAATIFNKFVEKEDYDINYNFYIAEANKIRFAVDNGQMSLFDEL